MFTKYALCKKAFSIGGESEIGGGGSKMTQKIGYHLWTAPYGQIFFTFAQTHDAQILKVSRGYLDSCSSYS